MAYKFTSCALYVTDPAFPAYHLNSQLPSFDHSFSVVPTGAWNTYCEMMQIQESGTIRATMLCTTPLHTDTASVWSW